jgi:hypothetical protein
MQTLALFLFVEAAAVSLWFANLRVKSCRRDSVDSIIGTLQTAIPLRLHHTLSHSFDEMPELLALHSLQQQQQRVFLVERP